MKVESVRTRTRKSALGPPYLWFAVISLLLGGCDSKEEANKSDVYALLAAIEEDYSKATNMLVAKSSLLTHHKTLGEWRNDGKHKLDYDFTMALIEARLYALESELGNSNQAAQHYTQCSNHIALGNLRRGVTSYTFNAQSVLTMVSIADTNLVLQWKAAKSGNP